MENATRFYELDENSQGLKSHAESRLIRKIKELTPSSLLEIGAGDGHFLKNFQHIKHFGMDINPQMVELAQKNGVIVTLGDITKKQDIQKVINSYVEVISANYVFTELTSANLETAFNNIYSILNQNGHLCFTITNPKEIHRMVYPGYRNIFEEEFVYEKLDIPFRVELEVGGEYEDVGIRDYHKPTSVYDSLLERAGFSSVIKEEIYFNLNYPYALLYDAQK